MAWEIAKQFNFCYGHRVYIQETNAEFALNRPPKCRHLHGHEGEVYVHLSASELENNMVTDFCNLEWLKKFLDETIDHKFIIGQDDPYFSKFLKYQTLLEVKVPNTDLVTGWSIDTSKIVDGPDLEVAQGYFIVDFVPTSENLARWLHNIVQTKMIRIGVHCSRIVWYETPKSKAEYKV